LTSIDEALQTFLGQLQIRYPKTVAVPLHSALNRALAMDVIAPEDLPRFARSAVDGYAVNAEDTVGASQFKPKTLRITSERTMGQKRARQLWTGNPIPKGANAVVMLENVKHTAKKIDVWVPVTPGENVSMKGEDLVKGQIALKAGTRLAPHHLGLAAALGKAEVVVAEKPKIAILATGNELAQVGTKLGSNQVFDVNRVVLAVMCTELGAEPLDLGIAEDDVREISGKLKAGLETADMAVTSGGTSVGGADLVPEAVDKIGKPGVVVHGLAMRPGMPTALAVIDGKPIVILPGNPVAAMIGFEVFVRPVICRMLGLEHEARPFIQAKMIRGIVTALGRRNFVRVHVFRHEDEYLAEPISARGSSIISTMTRANGYVVVPENRDGLEEGEVVLVRLFESVREDSEDV
jgi:molybdopterin molybdotransferase